MAAPGGPSGQAGLSLAKVAATPFTQHNASLLSRTVHYLQSRAVVSWLHQSARPCLQALNLQFFYCTVPARQPAYPPARARPYRLTNVTNIDKNVSLPTLDLSRLELAEAALHG